MEFTPEKFREEAASFTKNFNETAMSAAEKSVRLEKKGNVGVIVFDQHEEKANKLSTPNMLRLYELLVQVSKDSSIEALVLFSKKPTIFIAGADIAEIQRLASEPGVDEIIQKLQSIFTFLERLKIPSIAAIHGACMGGGTEMALACDYRMATDDPRTKIGLPEVMLGVLPGWGGTQRMPKLLGLEKSLDLILSGRTIDAKTAKRFGLVDKVVPKEFLEDKALAWAGELAKKKEKRDKTKPIGERMLEAVPGGKWVIFDQAKKALMSKTKGNYPAPLRALEVVRKTYGGSLDNGLKEEAKGFADLVSSPESKSLIHVYYLNESVKKDNGTDREIKTKEVKSAAVLGAGTMGGGIAQLFAAKGVHTHLKDINWDAITKGFGHAYSLFEKQVKRRKMKPSELDNAMARIQGTTHYGGFKNLDVVVEAVVENMDLKKKVFQELEANCGPQTVLATNTSSLSVTEMGRATKNPGRVVGMHFFNPVDKMPLIEIIRGKETSDEAVAAIFQFSKAIGKTPIVVGDGPGFVVNRILAPYLNEAVYLMAEGVPPKKLDAVLESFGMPMGPATLLDEIGLDVGQKVSKILYQAFGERMKPPALMDKVTEGGHYGKKTGRGIYIYEDGGKKKSVDTGLYGRLGITENSNAVSEDVIQKRMIYVMINEAARIVEEKLVRKVADVDIGMIYGTGFAPFRGGLLRYADSVGADAIVSDLELFSRTYGARFAPSAYLQQLAVGGKKFYAEKNS